MFQLMMASVQRRNMQPRPLRQNFPVTGFPIIRVFSFYHTLAKDRVLSDTEGIQLCQYPDVNNNVQLNMCENKTVKGFPSSDTAIKISILQLDCSAQLPFLLRSHFCSAVLKIEYKLQDMKLKHTELGLCRKAAEAKIIKVQKGEGWGGG